MDIKLRNEALIGKKNTNTVYVVTSEYEEEDCTSTQIEAIFSDYVKAARYCASQKSDNLYIEEWIANEKEVQGNEEVVMQWTFEADDKGRIKYFSNKFVFKRLAKNRITSEVLPRYKGEMNFFTIELALSIGVTEDEAREIAADRLAIYKAEKEI